MCACVFVCARVCLRVCCGQLISFHGRKFKNEYMLQQKNKNTKHMSVCSSRLQIGSRDFQH